ncbi:MAG: FHA domain-containing protein [Planctomycetota bacterium]
MDAVLVMIKADGSRRSFPLPEGATTVGRKNSCGLRIPLTSVSRLHCEFRVDGERVSLRDLGSSNGTFKNGQRVQDTDLHAGDEVEVGPVRFLVVVDGQPADSESDTGPALDSAAVETQPEPAAEASHESGLPTTGILSGGGSVDLAVDEVEPDQDVDEDDELAAAMASMDDGDGDDADGQISFGDDPDDSSEFAFTLDDDDDSDSPSIELLDEDDDKA